MGALKKVQNLLLILAAVLGVVTLIYLDVISRARESYHEAEKYMSWHANPGEKKSYVVNSFQNGKSRIDKLLSAKKLTEEKYREELDALEFQRDFHLGESSLKYAYQWYKDTYELFSPPESKWVRLARQKAPEVLRLWKEELKAQKIPFEDIMFE